MIGPKRTTKGRMAHLLGGILVVAATVCSLPTPAGAEPYMAIREGRKCGTCHVNQTGGGMRTLLANTHMQEITHYRDIFPELDEMGEGFNGQITSFFAMGADLRLTDSIIFQDDPDQNGLVPHKFLRGNVDENILDLREAALYFDVQLYEDFLSIYTDLSLAPGSPVAREVFGLLRGVIPWGGYVKAGRFYLDYGLKMETDNLFSVNIPSQDVFVRGRTGTGFTGFDDGLEIGFQPGPWHFTASVTDPSSGDTGVRVTSNAYGMWRDLPVVENAMLGASFLYNSPSGSDQYIYGFYGGSNLGPFAYQAEVDFIHQSFDGGRPSVGSFLAYGELNYLLLDWINTKVFGEYADNDGMFTSAGTKRTSSAQNRFGFGIEPFLGRFLQARLFYSIANGPKDVPETNQNRLILELHLFF